MKKNLDFLIGATFVDFIFQPTKGIIAPDNMFVINFKNMNILYSIHVFCFLRINKNNNILINSSDEYVDVNHSLLLEENAKNSILLSSINKIKCILAKEKIEKAFIEECGDLIISFSNDVKLKAIIDCSIEGYEYYRIIDFNKSKPLILARCNKEKVLLQ